MSDEEDDVDESLGLFEAAVHAGGAELAVPVVKSVLTVTDGSNQSADAGRLGGALARIFGGVLHDQPIETEAEEPRALADAVLEHVRRRDADVVVLPAPFGDDIGSLAHESLGAVVDLLITDLEIPLLVVRHACDADDAVGNPICIVAWDDRLQGAAVGWACSLASRDSRVDLVAAPDPSALAEIRALLGDEEGARMTDDLIARAETRLTGGVVAAAQRAGTAGEFDVTFQVRQGESIDRIAAELAGTERLTVTAFSREPSSASHHHARDVVLAASGTVLLIGV